MSFQVEIAGRFARDAAKSGVGEVVAAFRRSFYLKFPGERYACVGDESLGRGPLNALVAEFRLPAIGERIAITAADAVLWEPPAPRDELLDLASIRKSAAAYIPDEGLGCLVIGEHNALSGYAQPGLDALERWLVGNALGDEAALLIGLGPGLTPSGDDYLAGMLVALRLIGRGGQADALWRWLGARLQERTSAISAAHLAAAAAGEAHEALHAVLNGSLEMDRLDAVGHCSGWDALAGAVAVASSRR